MFYSFFSTRRESSELGDNFNGIRDIFVLKNTYTPSLYRMYVMNSGHLNEMIYEFWPFTVDFTKKVQKKCPNAARWPATKSQRENLLCVCELVLCRRVYFVLRLCCCCGVQFRDVTSVHTTPQKF